MTLNAVNDGERPAASPWARHRRVEGNGVNVAPRENQRQLPEPHDGLGGAARGARPRGSVRSQVRAALGARGHRARTRRRTVSEGRRLEQLAEFEAKNPTRDRSPSELMNGTLLASAAVHHRAGSAREEPPGVFEAKPCDWQTVDIFTLRGEERGDLRSDCECRGFSERRNVGSSRASERHARWGASKGWRVARRHRDAPRTRRREWRGTWS